MRAAQPVFLCPLWATASLQPSPAAGMLIDATNKKIGYKFYAQQALGVSAMDICLTVLGSTAGITLVARIETDNADAPSGDLVDALYTTAAFARPAAGTSWTGLQSFGGSAPALALNTPYWLVLQNGGGTAPSGTDSVQARGVQSLYSFGGRLRQHNGTNWTTTGVLDRECQIVLQFSDSSYFGDPVTAAPAASGLTKVFATNKQGLKWRSKVPLILRGVRVQLAKSTTPDSLLITAYAGSTPKTPTITIPPASILGNLPYSFWFSSGISLPSDTDLYIILSAATGGGDSSNCWNIWTEAFQSGYGGALFPTAFHAVSGTSADPTALTPLTTAIPMYFAPIIDDLAVDGVAAGGMIMPRVRSGY
jgi:hypothetical protein